jgi:uncharacterized protein YrrD
MTIAGTMFGHRGWGPLEMRLGKLIGLPVVTLDAGVRLGTIRGVEIHASDARIQYLRVNRPERRDDGVLAWSQLHSVGSDAVTVAAAASIADELPAAERDGLTPHLSDRLVLTENGTRLGHVDDYELDPVTGQIETFFVAPQGVLNRLTGRGCEFARSALVTIGADAIIVSDQILSAEAA